MNQSGNVPSTMEIVNRNLGRRYLAKRRFRLIGLFAILCSLLFIYDAIGIRFKELPITPERVLEALWRK